MRTLLTALVAAAATAVPANAAILGPACETRLVAAASGTSRSCETANPGDTNSTSGAWFRTVTLEVAEGAATAFVRCWTPYREHSGSVTQTGPGVAAFGLWDDETCRLTVTALADGTVASAASATSYRIHPR